jgi:phage terminase small subunit
VSEELSARQAAFVREYLVDGNGAKAALRAGYKKETARVQASRLLTKSNIKAAIEAGQQKLAEKTETEAEWVRRRLKEEASDFTEFASHSARIRALELLGKINGVFEVDNKQKADALTSLIDGLSGNVVGANPAARMAKQKDDDDD